MLGVAVWLRCLATLAWLALGIASASAQVAGKDFQPITPPQPTQSGNKVELIEFFSYACPHCESLQPSLSAGLKRKPADVEFRRIPVVIQDSWLPFARHYYTVEAMGLVYRLQHNILSAI